jgi:hypothetical protein
MPSLSAKQGTTQKYGFPHQNQLRLHYGIDSVLINLISPYTIQRKGNKY